MFIIKTSSSAQTQKLAQVFAREMKPPRTYARGILHFFCGIRRSIPPAFAKATAGPPRIHPRADAHGFLRRRIKKWLGKKPLVLALVGELGSGKTTFVQGLAKALGVREKVLSPTFVLLKVYKLPVGINFRHLVHIDCYRLDSAKDLLHLGFKNLLKDKDAVLLIEWADRVQNLLPRGTVWLRFVNGKRPHERVIQIFNFQ